MDVVSFLEDRLGDIIGNIKEDICVCNDAISMGEDERYWGGKWVAYRDVLASVELLLCSSRVVR